MEIKEHLHKNHKIAELISETKILQSGEDGINIMGNLYYQGYDKIIIHEKNIVSDFFDLKNGMAGEILQKFSNYRVRLAIVGDFSKYTKKSIQDFIRESNNGRQINFLATLPNALEALAN